MIYLLAFYIFFSYAFMTGIKMAEDDLSMIVILLAPVTLPIQLGGIFAIHFKSHESE